MASLYTQRLIIVVPLARQATAWTLSKQVDIVGGEGMFRVPLSASGNLPATHFWGSWAMTAAERTSLLSRFVDGANGVRVFDGNVVTAESVLTTLGLRRLAGVP